MGDHSLRSVTTSRVFRETHLFRADPVAIQTLYVSQRNCFESLLTHLQFPWRAQSVSLFKSYSREAFEGRILKMSRKGSGSEQGEREEDSRELEESDETAPNEYELQRAARIAENNVMLESVQNAANAL